MLLFFILRLNKKVMAILSFWTILFFQVPILKTQRPAGASETYFFLNFCCQITLYMWANKLRDIKGVIWELCFKTQQAIIDVDSSWRGHLWHKLHGCLRCIYKMILFKPGLFIQLRWPLSAYLCGTYICFGP